MTATVFFCVLLAALLHASWNALVKRGADKWVGMTGVVVGHAPLSLAAIAWAPAPTPDSLPYIAGSMALHFGYQLFLLWAYHLGDLTQVYPIARGAAPLLVASFSVLLLGVNLGTLELVAVATIGIGIISLGIARQHDGLRNWRAGSVALVTGIFIAGYSLVDGYGAREAGTAIGYYAWLSLGNAAIFAIFVAVVRPGVLQGIRTSGRLTVIVGSSASYVAYTLVVWAFTQAPVALVTALRETSIVFSLLIGVFVLKERLNLAKLASTAITLMGAAMLRLAR